MKMHGILLVNQAGETVASVGWEHLEGDVAMFGGFVSAIQMFIKKISGDVVEELRFGDMKLLIGRSNEHHVITLHEADKANAEVENREVVKLIQENGHGTLNDGLLSLIKEMVLRDAKPKEKLDKSVREWTESQFSKSKKSADEWGKTVF